MATQTEDGRGVQGGPAQAVYVINETLPASEGGQDIQQIEGQYPEGAEWPTGAQPVVIGAVDPNGNVSPLFLTAGFEIPVQARLSTSAGVSLLTSSSGGSADGLTVSGTLQVITAYQRQFNGSTWDRVRVANVFKPVTLASGTAETTIWTPASGKKFRLMGFLLTCGAASTLTFRDNTAGTIIATARGGTDIPIPTPPMGNGLLSASANNVLTVTRGTACTLDGFVFGTEE